MARSLIVSYQQTPSTLAFTRVTRKQLYASRKRVPLDGDQAPCQRGELSDDGSMIITTGMTGQGYFDDEQKWVPSDKLVGLDLEGKPVPLQPSTLSTAQALTEVEPEALLDTFAASIYALDDSELDAALGEALRAGKIFRFDFNLRADYHMETGFLLANEHGVFAIIGNPREVLWCELERPAVELDDADEDDDGDLDFEMF